LASSLIKLQAYDAKKMSTYREEKILEKAADLLVEMERSNCEPNSFTCCILMDGLCKDGRVEEAMT
jgi:pentatricopeptide repeat protein